MSRKNFHNLLERYLKGNCTAAEKETVEAWYKMLDEDFANPSKQELQALENRLWTKVSSKLNQNVDPPKANKSIYQLFAGKRSIVLRAAALAILVLSVGFLLFNPKQKKPDFKLALKSSDTIYSVNKTKNTLTIYLEDGSLVKLQPGSALTYPQHFTQQKREVYLSGEGYFLVSKNAKKPFLVYNNNTVTRVVGTSFIIKTNLETQQTEVSVQTGRVVVMENSANNIISKMLHQQSQVVLTPNQKTVYNTVGQQFKTTLVADPIPVLKPEEALKKADFVFTDTPVAAVLKLLEKTYAIKIEAVKEVSESTFTGDINELSLYNKLDLICQAVHASYTIEGTSIYIK